MDASIRYLSDSIRGAILDPSVAVRNATTLLYSDPDIPEEYHSFFSHYFPNNSMHAVSFTSLPDQARIMYLRDLYTQLRLGKSTGNPRVSGAVPVPNLPKNPYSYLHGFTCGYEQMGSTCQRARIHSQTVILRVYTCLRACARESGKVALVVRERARVRLSSRG